MVKTVIKEAHFGHFLLKVPLKQGGAGKVEKRGSGEQKDTSIRPGQNTVPWRLEEQKRTEKGRKSDDLMTVLTLLLRFCSKSL